MSGPGQRVKTYRSFSTSPASGGAERYWSKVLDAEVRFRAGVVLYDYGTMPIATFDAIRQSILGHPARTTTALLDATPVLGDRSSAIEYIVKSGIEEHHHLLVGNVPDADIASFTDAIADCLVLASATTHPGYTHAADQFLSAVVGTTTEGIIRAQRPESISWGEYGLLSARLRGDVFRHRVRMFAAACGYLSRFGDVRSVMPKLQEAEVYPVKRTGDPAFESIARLLY